MLKEIAPSAGGVNPLRSEIAIGNPCCRFVVDLREQRFDPCRRAVGNRQRLAALAGPETCKECFANRTEVDDVLRLRLARAARRPAEYARRTNAEEEDAVVGCIAGQIDLLHLANRRQSRHAESVAT